MTKDQQRPEPIVRASAEIQPAVESPTPRVRRRIDVLEERLAPQVLWGDVAVRMP